LHVGVGSDETCRRHTTRSGSAYVEEYVEREDGSEARVATERRHFALGSMR